MAAFDLWRKMQESKILSFQGQFSLLIMQPNESFYQIWFWVLCMNTPLFGSFRGILLPNPSFEGCFCSCSASQDIPMRATPQNRPTFVSFPRDLSALLGCPRFSTCPSPRTPISKIPSTQTQWPDEVRSWSSSPNPRATTWRSHRAVDSFPVSTKEHTVHLWVHLLIVMVSAC